MSRDCWHRVSELSKDLYVWSVQLLPVNISWVSNRYNIKIRMVHVDQADLPRTFGSIMWWDNKNLALPCTEPSLSVNNEPLCNHNQVPALPFPCQPLNPHQPLQTHDVQYLTFQSFYLIAADSRGSSSEGKGTWFCPHLAMAKLTSAPCFDFVAFSVTTTQPKTRISAQTQSKSCNRKYISRSISTKAWIALKLLVFSVH